MKITIINRKLLELEVTMDKSRKLAGSLIKYHRERLGITQKELCSGICVVSHLSKIENNKVDSSPQIIQELFQKLGMNYYDDEDFIKKNQYNFEKFYSNINYHRKTDSIVEEIIKEKDRLINSPLIIDYLLVEAYSDINKHNNIKRLSELEIYMNTQQIGWFYIVKAWNCGKSKEDNVRELLSRSYALLRNSYSLLTLMSLELGEGNFYKAIELGSETISLALIEGNVMAIANVNLLIGNCYAAQSLPDLMLPYYERAKNILFELDRQDLIAAINYNTGATFFESGQHEKALYYLEKSHDKRSMEDYSAFLLYHKLGLVHLRLDSNNKAKDYIEKAKEKLSLLSEDYDVNSLMIEVAELQLENGYLDNPVYLEKLEKLCRILNVQHPKGFYLFHKRMLEQVYCHLRQYKKAYLLK